ncbi:Transcription initiation factor TFIID subunit 6, partial [Intoshia linei]
MHVKSDEWIEKSLMSIIIDGLDKSKLSDEAEKILRKNVNKKTSLILQEAKKLRIRARRKKMISQDITDAMKYLNFGNNFALFKDTNTPFLHSKHAISDDKDKPIEDFIINKNINIPCDLNLQSYWLCIKGVCPNIQENVINQVDQIEETDAVEVQKLTKISYSIEQQLFYKDLTESCVCAIEKKRTDALLCIREDPSIKYIYPRIVVFICEGIKQNVNYQNLLITIYILKMLEELLRNPHIPLIKYLHEIIPTLISCILATRLTNVFTEVNSWITREFYARLLATISKKYSNGSNNINSRIIQVLVSDFLSEPVYSKFFGVASFLFHNNSYMVDNFILPNIKTISDIARNYYDQMCSNEEMTATIYAKQVKFGLGRIAFILHNMLKSYIKGNCLSWGLHEFTEKFGQLGSMFFYMTKEMEPLNEQINNSSTLKGTFDYDLLEIIKMNTVKFKLYFP